MLRCRLQCFRGKQARRVRLVGSNGANTAPGVTVSWHILQAVSKTKVVATDLWTEVNAASSVCA